MNPASRSKTTAQRLAEYAAELKAKGIDDFRAIVEGRTLTFDFKNSAGTIENMPQYPADLVDP